MNQDTLRMRTSSNVVRVVAIVLLLLGIPAVGLSLAAIAIAPVRAILPGVFGLIFTAAGCMMLETTGVTIDKPAGRLSLWSRWLGRTWEKTYQLGAFHHLTIVRYWNQSRRGPPKLYRVLLTCKTGGDAADVELVDGLGTALKGRALASQVARFISVPLEIVDATAAPKPSRRPSSANNGGSAGCESPRAPSGG